MHGENAIAKPHALFTAEDFAPARTLAEASLGDEQHRAEACQALGLIAYRDSRFAEAVAQLRRSVELCPQAATWSNLGAALRADRQSAEAEAAYRRALLLQPDLVSAGRNLANLLIDASRLTEAEAVLLQTLQHNPRIPDLQRRLAAVSQTLGRYSAAAQRWRDVMAAAPADGDAALNLAKCLHATGDYTGAEAVLCSRLAAQGDDTAALEWLGRVLGALGKLHEAERAFADCLAIAPGRANALVAQSDVLRRLGRLAPAEAAARQALAIDPQLAGAAVNLGNALGDQGRHADAEAAFDLALSLQSDCAEAFNGRGLARLRRGAPVAAADDFLRVLQLRPDLAAIGVNLGTALLAQGQPVAALDAVRKACAHSPEVGAVRRSVLFCLNYQPDLPAAAIFAEYQAWGTTQPLLSPQLSRPDRTPGRRLNIGYVSPDFRQNSASFFIKPLLAAHDRSEVELFCYAELLHGDSTTEQLQALADRWRPTVELSDEALAETIRRDRIDVLVDMGGHTTNSRIAVFAYKPAPVQIEYLLGHGATSGMPMMDAFLADARLVPLGSEHLFSERVVRLDRIPLVYAPPAEMPAVGPLPARTRGYVMFGHFGRTARIHDGVIAAWARILNRVPGSRLMLNSAPFNEPALRAVFADRFAKHGIESHRLDLVCTWPQLQTLRAYGGIDIALDPFPHNAGTTTIEALWMGVPVVSLADRPPVGRFGASILHAVGLDDWSAPDLDAYAGRAVRAAVDLDGLARLRGTLRERCLASPLNDAAGLARTMESTYRSLLDASL